MITWTFTSESVTPTICQKEVNKTTGTWKQHVQSFIQKEVVDFTAGVNGDVFTLIHVFFVSVLCNSTPHQVLCRVGIKEEQTSVFVCFFLFFHHFLPPHWPSSLPGCRQVGGQRESSLIVLGVGGLSNRCCSLTGRRVTDSWRSLVSGPAHPAWFSRLTWISWRTITTVFDNSRYSWKTCRRRLSPV